MFLRLAKEPAHQELWVSEEAKLNHLLTKLTLGDRTPSQIHVIPVVAEVSCEIADVTELQGQLTALMTNVAILTPAVNALRSREWSRTRSMAASRNGRPGNRAAVHIQLRRVLALP